jgi:acyl-CoA synthetase (NDP forming)
MTPQQKTNLQRLLRPRHIAFVGGDDAASAANQSLNGGFVGQIWGVNPKRNTLGQHPCFARVEDLPEPPDATFLAVPRRQAPEVVGQLAQIGAGGVVCYTAGFRELGDEGAHLEQQLIDAALDLALVGPNVYGFLNYVTGAHLWPFAHGGVRTTHGPVIISQSGMLSSSLTFNQRSVSFSYVIGAGNQSILGIEDYLETLVGHPEVNAFGLYVETLRDIPKFADAAIRALETNTPIVALKVGHSEIAARSTITHTGSLSGSSERYQALFERLGIISVGTPSLLLETLKMVTFAGAPAGNRLAAFTCSGGDVAMLADAAEDTDVMFPEPSAAAQSDLAGLLPEIATISNPLDYTTPLWGQEAVLNKVFRSTLKDGFDSALLVQDYPPQALDEDRPMYQADARAFIEATRAAGIPGAICSTVPENIDADARQFLLEQRVAPLQGVAEAVTAISGASKFGQKQKEFIGQLDVMRLRLPGCDHKKLQNYDEWESKQVLARFEIPVPDGRLASAAETPAAAAELGFPVAVKFIHKNVTHKTDLGALRLHLMTKDEVGDAVADITERVGISDGTFLIEQMITPVIAEVLVGVVNDDQFGHVLTIGSGGALVELIRDTHTLLLPTTRKEIQQAITGLRVSHLIAGYRNQTSVPLEHLVDLILRVTYLAESLGPALGELELNPVLVAPGGPVAVDAVLRASPNQLLASDEK